MSCHENKNEDQNNSKNINLKHMLHMVLCCGLPILIIFSLPFVSRISPGVAGILGLIAPFLCPIMMIGMMAFMLLGNKKSNKSCCSNETDQQSQTETLL